MQESVTSGKFFIPEAKDLKEPILNNVRIETRYQNLDQTKKCSKGKEINDNNSTCQKVKLSILINNNRNREHLVDPQMLKVLKKRQEKVIKIVYHRYRYLFEKEERKR